MKSQDTGKRINLCGSSAVVDSAQNLSGNQQQQQQQQLQPQQQQQPQQLQPQTQQPEVQTNQAAVRR